MGLYMYSYANNNSVSNDNNNENRSYLVYNLTCITSSRDPFKQAHQAARLELSLLRRLHLGSVPAGRAPATTIEA